MENRVYIIDVNEINVNIEQLYFLLPLYCKNKLENCSNFNLRRIRIIAWYYLGNILLKNYNIDLNNCNIYENEYGKPYIDEIYFNITHSNDMIGIIISNTECGIDIEKISLNIDKDKFAKKILNSKEYEEFLKNPSVNFLIKKWTKIETYYKIKGRGISFSTLNKSCDDNIYTILINDYYLSYGPGECEIIKI